TAAQDAAAATPEDAAAAPVLEAAPEPVAPHRFVFGSYGRVVAASNLDGRLGRSTNLVAFGPRVDEDTYAELELRRDDRLAPGVWSRVVATLAISGPLFHFDGQFDERLAVRNLYAEVEGALLEGLSLWAGSRMVRGDDIYLLDWWPLDNLSVIGGGASYRVGELLSFRFCVGIGRPKDPFYLQTRDVVAPRGFEPVEVSVLDRPRIVTALRTTISPIHREDFGLKLVLYGEAHTLPSGERTLDDGATEALPRDRGYLLGAQVGLWHNRAAEPGPTGPHTERSFVNLFARYAHGLAAYDTFDSPVRTGSGVDSGNASEALLALSGNFEAGLFGVQVGAYYRWFRDSDSSAFAGGGVNEGAFDVRPQVFLGDFAGVALDLSYQALALNTLDEATGDPVRGKVFKLGLIPFVSLGGRGTYARPRLRLIYAVSMRDDGARGFYPAEDPRSGQGVEHFLGVGAEWWFDSTSYSK
ncbi:MAG: carbohydrate porin, partial [Deltaproteobacteria bacterium]|nr:carbohydrate porin [Deltaproteobacteria bacterium]